MDQKDQRDQMNRTDQNNPLRYWRVIWGGKIFLLLIIIVSSFTTAFVSLRMPNIYQATAIIIPIVNQGAGGLSTLTQQLGGLAGISSGNPLSSEIISLLQSKILREKIIERYNLLPVLFPKKWDGEKRAWKKNERGITFSVQEIIKKIAPANSQDAVQKNDAPHIWDGLRRLSRIVKVNNNVRENNITLSVEFPDPVMAAKMANYFLTTLNDHMTSEAKRVAGINMKYLEQQVDKTADPFIKQKLYALIAQQIETSMLAEVKENFAFKIIEPPKEPDQKIKPKRALMVMLSFVVSLLAGI
ncbi:MAG: Wzz/FepE/Etk N-terminal domain-containing protein, partial [Deltaproteobacteria bacterium]|nr:Wzz/FepE/Etk N-terminal domain-containing protein [Deltaproteobacteria bacterium]